MNDEYADETAGEGASASSFRFTGSWREFLPIALSNLALIIVTLGIYRFWAKARERRYLWSRTHFIDDRLEWTGTGKEMFLGFLIVMAFLLPSLLFLQFGLQALILRGHFVVAGLTALALYIGFFYLYGVALFRALRYRLSRTYWHGIRGGSDDAGWSYGLSALGKTAANGFLGGLLTPWMMTELWNERWNAMSFGPHPFAACADSKGLKRRWLLIYVAVVGIAMVVGVVGVMTAPARAGRPGPGALPLGAMASALLFYALVGLASLAYYAAYYRKVIGTTSLAGLDFGFTARTWDWLLFILGTAALVVCTLGLGIVFVGYRNWSFAVRHLEATGTIDLDTLTQSTTRSATDAEGLASAFDIGAI